MNLGGSYGEGMDMLARPTLSPSAGTLGLDHLAATIDREGLASVGPAALDRLAERARAVGVTPVLIDVLVDRDAPEAARNRAFGRIHRLLARDLGG